jgi:hypothetical protein
VLAQIGVGVGCLVPIAPFDEHASGRRQLDACGSGVHGAVRLAGWNESQKRTGRDSRNRRLRPLVNLRSQEPAGR